MVSLVAARLLGGAGCATRAATPGLQARLDCSTVDAQAAELAAVAPRTWADLQAAFARYSICDDGSIAEGFSDTVGRLLAENGGRLPELSTLCAKDRGFESFVVRHADETLADRTIVAALVNVRLGCPPRASDLCQDLEFRLQQTGAARGPRASPALLAIEQAAPGVVWSPPMLIDVDGDGVLDTVALGRWEEQAIVGITRGAAPATARVFRLPRATTSEGHGCGPPAAARVLAEVPPQAEDADAPAAAKTAGGPGARPFRVEMGDCDAFHFYSDGKEVSVWRR